MRKSAKIITALSVAGLAVAAGSAFTGTGVTITDQTQFVGGKVSQTVSGANLESVVYQFAEGDTAKNNVNGITLTFVGGVGQLVQVAAVGGSGGTFDCANVNTDEVSTCSFVAGVVGEDGTPATGVSGITKLDVTVTPAPAA